MSHGWVQPCDDTTGPHVSSTTVRRSGVPGYSWIVLRALHPALRWIVFLGACNVLFVVVFAVEAALKIFSFGPKVYIAEWWNRFDLAVVWFARAFCVWPALCPCKDLFGAVTRALAPTCCCAACLFSAAYFSSGGGVRCGFVCECGRRGQCPAYLPHRPCLPAAEEGQGPERSFQDSNAVSSLPVEHWLAAVRRFLHLRCAW